MAAVVTSVVVSVSGPWELAGSEVEVRVLVMVVEVSALVGKWD